jgi:hypothetical protein
MREVKHTKHGEVRVMTLHTCHGFYVIPRVFCSSVLTYVSFSEMKKSLISQKSQEANLKKFRIFGPDFACSGGFWRLF